MIKEGRRDSRKQEITEDRYLTITEVSEYIRRSKPAIRMLVLRKIIPYRKPGGRLLFDKDEIDRWIQLSDGVSFDEINSR